MILAGLLIIASRNQSCTVFFLFWLVVEHPDSADYRLTSEFHELKHALFFPSCQFILHLALSVTTVLRSERLSFVGRNDHLFFDLDLSKHADQIRLRFQLISLADKLPSHYRTGFLVQQPISICVAIIPHENRLPTFLHAFLGRRRTSAIDLFTELIQLPHIIATVSQYVRSESIRFLDSVVQISCRLESLWQIPLPSASLFLSHLDPSYDSIDRYFRTLELLCFSLCFSFNPSYRSDLLAASCFSFRISRGSCSSSSGSNLFSLRHIEIS